MIGRRFGLWVVLAFAGTVQRAGITEGRRFTKVLWRCQCDCCGTVRDVFGSNLRSGGSGSCGCTKRKKPAAAGVPAGERAR